MTHGWLFAKEEEGVVSQALEETGKIAVKSSTRGRTLVLERVLKGTGEICAVKYSGLVYPNG